MRILVTNDDGIHGPGLAVLERVALSLSDDVTVVAPEQDQSGVAHSLSLNDPLRLRKISPRHFAVKGTPTDCVIMGIRSLMLGAPPDLILSGVNRGQNIAEDVSYSGTIAGAMEGTFLGIPSIALSQAYGHHEDDVETMYWDCAETHAPGLIKQILSVGIAPDIFININFPDCPADKVVGTCATVQGRRDAQTMKIDARHDGRGNPYYWIAFERFTSAVGAGTDLEALRANRISVTPLRINMTDEASIARYAQAFK